MLLSELRLSKSLIMQTSPPPPKKKSLLMLQNYLKSSIMQATIPPPTQKNFRTTFLLLVCFTSPFYLNHHEGALCTVTFLAQLCTLI